MTIRRSHDTEIVLTDLAGNPKPLWRENFFGRHARKIVGLNGRNPLFGRWVLALRLRNTITNAGHAAANGRISNQGGYSPFVNLAIGTGSQGTPASATVLAAEVTTNGGQRGSATATQLQTSVANDTMQLVKTWTFSGSFAVTEEGIFDNASSGGTLLAYQSFAAINVADTDQLTITHKVQS